MRVEGCATSVSWIPSEAVTGLMKAGFRTGLSHYDDAPTAQLGSAELVRPALEGLRERDAFRFANHLQAWAEFDGDEVVSWGQDGGIVMGATTVRLGRLGLTFQAVALPDLRLEPATGPGWITITQTCGGRTAWPLPRAIRAAPFFRLQSPLVWTTLSVTLHSDGTSDVALTGASPFPRHWVYGPGGTLMAKAGTTDWPAWVAQPSWHATPWGDQDAPVQVTAAETALERQLSRQLMHGSTPPQITTVDAGTVLATQGEPGGSLYLVLDGIVKVEVDGETVAELGPGTVLGERAVLESGARTATLTAVTPVRIAESSGDQFHRIALAELAEGHRREELSS